MARYQVILAYDGTNFYGSQRQAEARTVQSAVEAALRKLNWTEKPILLAGRTDAGVHASGQVAAFDLDWRHPPEDLQNALNALLPEDVAVSSVAETGPDFHPRFDAQARAYRYRIYCQSARDPLRARYAWQVWPAPQLEPMQRIAKALLGVHDFAAFGSATGPSGNTVREVIQADWQQVGDEVIFEITANAFLYHMVRRLVFVQVSAGQGKLEVEEVLHQFQYPQGPVLQGLAPPNGLSLVKVHYPPAKGEPNRQEMNSSI